MDPIFFAFCTARGPLSLNIFLEKNIRFGHPYKKFVSEKIDCWCFRADMGPKTIIFGLHVKFPKKISLQKKIIFSDKYSWKKAQKTIFSILAISMRINNFIFFPGDDKLFSMWTLIKMKKKKKNSKIDFFFESIFRRSAT
jgi:hypothetical protein